MIQNIANPLLNVFNTLGGIAADKGHEVKAVTISVDGTDLAAGIVAGHVTVVGQHNDVLGTTRSRRKFKVNGDKVTLLGVTRQVAA